VGPSTRLDWCGEEQTVVPTDSNTEQSYPWEVLACCGSDWTKQYTEPNIMHGWLKNSNNVNLEVSLKEKEKLGDVGLDG
jgi:hypothetical protein